MIPSVEDDYSMGDEISPSPALLCFEVLSASCSF